MKTTLKSIVATISIIIICAATWIVVTKTMRSVSDVDNFSITLISFIVAVVALLLSLLTYFSIDSVSSISTMEGNVLENEKYSISAASELKKYVKYTSQKDVCEEFFNEQIALAKQCHTSKQFADCLQKMVDDYCIAGSLNYNDFLYQKKFLEVWKILERKARQLNSISNGTQHIIDENIKLIRFIYKVDIAKSSIEHAETDNISIEDIRGDIFKNPYTRYLYIDTVGREYVEYARNYLSTKIHPNNNRFLFQINELNAIKEMDLPNNMSNWDKVKLGVYLDKAENAYSFSLKEDLINQPYTQYIFQGLLRVAILKSIFFNRNDEKVKAAYLKSIEEWNRFVIETDISFEDIDNSYLKTGYFSAYYASMFYYYNYLNYFNEDTSEFNDTIKYINHINETGSFCGDYKISPVTSFLKEWI